MVTPFIYFTFNTTLRRYVLAMLGKSGGTVVPATTRVSKLGPTQQN